MDRFQQYFLETLHHKIAIIQYIVSVQQNNEIVTFAEKCQYLLHLKGAKIVYDLLLDHCCSC